MRTNTAAPVRRPDYISFIDGVADGKVRISRCVGVTSNASVIVQDNYLVSSNVRMSNRNHSTAVARDNVLAHGISNVNPSVNSPITNGVDGSKWRGHCRIICRPCGQPKRIPKVDRAILYI